MKNLAEQDRRRDRLHNAPGNDHGENVHKYRQHRNRWSALAAEEDPVGDHRAGVKMVRRPPALQPGPAQPAKNEKSHSARERREIDKQQRRPAARITDKAVAPWQACNDDDGKRDQADCAVDEDGIGRCAPSGAAAGDQPESYGVAADRGWQGLVEECSDQIEAHRLSCRQRRAALRADLAPSQHADKNLQEGHGNRHADPAQARYIDARRKLGEIDLAQREIKQRRGDQYFYRRKQDPTHVVRGSSV